MKDWKYILYVSVAVALFIAVRLMAPKHFDWTVTLAHDDKDPYGTYALSELMPSVLNDNGIENSYQTMYELQDSLAPRENILIISSRFSPDPEDIKALLEHVEAGGTAIVSAQYYLGTIADTLAVQTRDNLFEQGVMQAASDSSSLRFSATAFDTTATYWYRSDNIHNYFESFDSTRTTVVARNDLDKPVTIKINFGKGILILNATPLIFTNIYLLSGSNHEFISGTLSYFADAPVRWIEYYHLGRMEASTPLRFVLSNEPLRWAYFITVFGVLAFMVFEAKRKQRIIPILNPPTNTTLEFVATIGNLYFQHGDHKNLAEKKIQFLLEQIRTGYFLSTSHLDDKFIEMLSQKSGKSTEQLTELFNTVRYILKAEVINIDILIDLHEKIEKFNDR
jgi:hypothetical protein